MLQTAESLVMNQRAEFGAQVKISIRPQGALRWSTTLFASDSPSGIAAVAAGEADLAIVNPSAMLTMAYRGTGPYPLPLPVRAITVIPQHDHVGLAVRGDYGITYLEEVAERRIPLRVSLRGNRRDHSLHTVVPHILAAAGCPFDAIESWGGQISYDDGLFSDPGKVGLVTRGERDAILDEAFDYWADRALGAGMTFLSLRAETVRSLVALGYRRGEVLAADYPQLPGDVQTIDFSGWPVFCHAEAPETFVEAVCAGIHDRREQIPWEGDGSLPLERMCGDTPEAPLDVPMHPAAKRFWTRRGIL